MRKLLLFLILASFCAIPAKAQLGNVYLKHYASDPTGTACGRNQMAVNDSTLLLYGCNNGVFAIFVASVSALPSSAGFTATAANNYGFDTTNLNWHCWNGASDAMCPTFTVAPNNGDAVTWISAAGQYTLGASTPVGGGTSFVKATVSSPLQFQFLQYDGSSVLRNVTPGISGRTTALATDTTNCSTDRGTLLTLTNASTPVSTTGQAGVTCLSNFFTRFWLPGALGATLKFTTSTVNGIAGATGITYPGNTWVDVVSPDNSTYMAVASRAVKCTGTNMTETLNADGTVTCNSTAAGGSGIPYGAGAGSVNVMTVTTSPAVATNAAGTAITVLPNLANTTTTPTLAVGGQTALTIVKGPTAAALIAGDYNTTTNAVLISNGTQWVLQNPMSGQAGINLYFDIAGDLQGISAGAGNLGSTNQLLAIKGATITAGTAFVGSSYHATGNGNTATFQGGIDASASSALGAGVFAGANNTSTNAAAGGGAATFRGGDTTGATGTVTPGAVTIRGGNSSSTSAPVTPPGVSIIGGSCTAVASATACAGQVKVLQPYFTTGTANVNDLACVTAANTIAGCSGTTVGQFVGVIDSVTSNNVFVAIIQAGGTHTFNATSATFTNLHWVCQSSAAANLVVDSATICGNGAGVGIYIGATGTQTAPVVFMRPF